MHDEKHKKQQNSSEGDGATVNINLKQREASSKLELYRKSAIIPLIFGNFHLSAGV